MRLIKKTQPTVLNRDIKSEMVANLHTSCEYIDENGHTHYVTTQTNKAIKPISINKKIVSSMESWVIQI